MQLKIKAGIILALTMSSFYACATAPTAAHYAGIDYIATNLPGRDHDNYAMRLTLPQYYHSFQVYAGHRFDNDVGLNIGWQQSKVQHQYHTFVAGETFLGDPQQAGDRSSISSRIQAINFDVTGYINVTESFEAVGILGVALMRANMNGTVYAKGVTNNLFPSKNFNNFIPRVGMVLQYFFPLNIGIRILGYWEGTDLYRMKFTDDDGIRCYIKPFRQSWSLGFGIVGKFKQ